MRYWVRMAEDFDKRSDAEVAAFLPKRGRPSQKQIEAIDNAILTAARELFLAEGYASTAMEAVAAKAGVSKATLYSRHKAKPSLLQAVVADRISAWAKQSPNPPDPEECDISEYLLRFGIYLLETLSLPEIWQFERIVLDEINQFSEVAYEFYVQGHQKLIDNLARDIQKVASHSGRTVRNPRDFAVVFISAIEGWHRGEHMRLNLNDEDCARFVSGLVAIFIGGEKTW